MEFEKHAMSAAETIFALRERIKELTCLYKITDLANRTDLSFNDFMAEVLSVIPRSMQYPSTAGVRITIDDLRYESPNLEIGSQHISAEISANQIKRGKIEVFYQDSAGVTFLDEETQLLKGIAQQFALVLERKSIEENNVRLQEQLRDRKSVV